MIKKNPLRSYYNSVKAIQIRQNEIKSQRNEDEGLFILLPLELMIHLLSFLTLKETILISLVSWKWFLLIEDSRIWKQLIQSEAVPFSDDSTSVDKICWKCKFKCEYQLENGIQLHQQYMNLERILSWKITIEQ